MTKEEVAWLAGILEGEACFDFTDIYKRRYPRIRLEMTDRDIVVRVQSLIGGIIYKRLHKNKNYSTSFRLVVARRKLVQPVLESIFPYLGKRRKAKVSKLLNWYKKNPTELRL